MLFADALYDKVLKKKNEKVNSHTFNLCFYSWIVIAESILLHF